MEKSIHETGEQLVCEVQLKGDLQGTRSIPQMELPSRTAPVRPGSSRQNEKNNTREVTQKYSHFIYHKLQFVHFAAKACISRAHLGCIHSDILNRFRQARQTKTSINYSKSLL